MSYCHNECTRVIKTKVKIKIVITLVIYLTYAMLYSPLTDTILRQQQIKSRRRITTQKLPECLEETKKVTIDERVPDDLTLRNFSITYGVEQGGWWMPSVCTPLTKVAIIVPYRDRGEHLRVFLRHIHPILQRQKLHYRIVVVEQLDPSTPFNKGSIANAGFIETLKIFPNFDCFVFHDVDLLSETDRNYYDCSASPRHMGVFVDTLKYAPVLHIIGGVGAFRPEHYRDVNGFSNCFFGWGGEDDDLYGRFRKRGYTVSQPTFEVGKYTMLKFKHHQKVVKNSLRHNLLWSTKCRMDEDGLNSVNYTLKETIEKQLYTLIKLTVDSSSNDARCWVDRVNTPFHVSYACSSASFEFMWIVYCVVAVIFLTILWCRQCKHLCYRS